ncbi:MAG: hypothetical protein ACLTR6_12325 [Clostridium fessum]
MKLFHLSDLHIGKMLNGYSLRESQKNAFLQILKYAEGREAGCDSDMRGYL